MASSTPISIATTPTTTKPVELNVVMPIVATNSVPTTTSSTFKVLSPELQSKSFSEEYGGAINAGAWPAFALIIVCIFLFVFRKEISGFLGRCNRIKVPGADFDASSSTKEQEKKEEKKEEQQTPDTQLEEEKTEIKPTEPRTAEEWKMDMIFSALDKKADKFESAYKELVKLNEGKKTRDENEILYLKLSHMIGKTDAIKKLETFLKEPNLKFDAHMALGYCYDYSRDFNNAESFYSKALNMASTDKEKSSAAIGYSESLYKNDKKNESLRTLGDILSEINDSSSKVSIYKGMADIYEKEKDYENRAFILDKAIELEPNNFSLIFNAGYSYSESKYNELSLFHYKNAKAINPADDAVQNNLGVLYDNLDMPIKSIESYKTSSKLESTLANANIAYRLMNAGFISEAKDILNSAKDKEYIHPNVNSALSEIPKKVENEDKTEDEQIKKATKLRKFFLEYIDAKTTKSDMLKSISGDWKSEDGTTYNINVKGEKIYVTWGKKRISLEFKYKFEGTITNNSCILDFYDHEYRYAKSEHEFVKNQDKGYLFCSLAGNKICFVKISDSQSKKIEVLTKVDI